MKRKGFTLIELLVTISIIGILSAISLFALTDARKSARDARRKSDIESIRSALELYKADCGTYKASLPSAGSALTSDAPPTCPASGIIYLQKTPGDPTATTTVYKYNRISTVRYALCATLEETPVPGFTATQLADCGAGNCPGGAACNYVTWNP